MTLDQYVSLLNDCTRADTQLGLFPVLVNEALKELQRRRSWRAMKGQVNFTIASGNGQANLPSNFKEPQSGLNPMRGLNAAQSPTGFDLWYLYSKQELERLAVIGVGAPDNKAYIDFDGTNWIIVTMGQVGMDTQFTLDSYLFFPDLVLGTDHNYLTDQYPMMVLEQAKVFAFRQGSMDPKVGDRMIELAAAAQVEVERQFAIASADDGYREVRGRRFRMGGF